MIARSLQMISVAWLFTATIAAAPLQPGRVYDLSFRHVDGGDISIANGHVTIITVVTRADEEKAHAVADLVPERYIGDQKYRYVTLVNFEGKVPGPLRGVTRAVIRNRLEAEAKELQPQYDAKNLKHNPRKDLFVVPDFDGTVIEKLGLAPDASVSVFVFDGRGKLVAHWNGVPPGDALPKALAEAQP